MAFSPIYNVSLVKSDQDITDHVVSLHYEDCTEEDDIVTIELEKLTPEWIDKMEINKGAEIAYLFGFQGGTLSGKRVAIIKDFEVTYDEQIKGTINALDQGFLFKKATSNKVYKDKTTSEIIEEVAKLFGIDYEIEATTVKHKSEPVGNLTYWKFLQKLTARAGSVDKKKGAFQLFIRNNKLYFKQKDLSKKSKRTFTYGNGDGEVVSFRPKYEQKESDSSSVSVSGIDPETNTPYTEKAEPGKETATGEKVVHYDVNGVIIPNTPENAGKMKTPSGTTKAEAKAQTKGSVSKAADGELTATLELKGDTGIEADDIITMAGVAQKHSGNWYVMKVIQDVSSSGFTTELELNKTGSKKSGTETTGKNSDANKSKGKDGADHTKEVKKYEYDVNGNLKNTGSNGQKVGSSGGGSW